MIDYEAVFTPGTRVRFKIVPYEWQCPSCFADSSEVQREAERQGVPSRGEGIVIEPSSSACPVCSSVVAKIEGWVHVSYATGRSFTTPYTMLEVI